MPVLRISFAMLAAIGTLSYNFGVILPLFAAAPDAATAAPAVFLVGMASILYLTATTAIVQVEARPEMHGRVLSLQSVVLIGTVPVGGPPLSRRPARSRP